MALTAVLEADLRSLSAEARRKYPAIREAAEHAILKLRTGSDPNQIVLSDELLSLYLVTCECRNAKLSVLALSFIQKLLAHDAVSRPALHKIIATLQEHSETNDETLHLKSLQTILAILQSQLHPDDESTMGILLGLCLGYLGSTRNADSVHSTAAATLRQAVALIFARVVSAESLPTQKPASGRRTASRSNSVSGDVSRSMLLASPVSSVQKSRDVETQVGKLGLRLMEDLAAVASGAPASWLNVYSLQRTFALDMIDYVLSNYVSLFKHLRPYQETLRHQICSLLITSLRATSGDDGEPSFRRIVLKAVANVIRLYSSVVMTECEVFMNTLVKNTDAALPFWHRVMVLEILRGFCIESRILCFLFETFDMRPENSDVVQAVASTLSRIVTNMQGHDASEESLATVSGMFNSKANGLEWSIDNELSGSAMAVAAEAYTLTLAIEGLLGIVFTVATLTDEASDAGEVSSPRCQDSTSAEVTIRGGHHATLCIAMVNALWHNLLKALSLVLYRCNGEALVLEVLKAYQAFTQACGILRLVEPRDAYLASLCKFTFAHGAENERNSGHVNVSHPMSFKRADSSDSQESVVLTPKNVQALRTLFNIAHRLDNVLGSSWILVLRTLAMLDRIIHSPHATTQEVSAVVPRKTREHSQPSDFNILSTLDNQLFESSGIMSTEAVCSLLAGLREVSKTAVNVLAQAGTTSSGSGGQEPQTLPKMFAVERMIAVLKHNLHRPQVFWDDFVDHFLELAEHDSPQVRAIAMDAVDRAICTVLDTDQLQKDALREEKIDEKSSFEYAIIKPIKTIYTQSRKSDVKLNALRVLLHLLQRRVDKLHFTWFTVFELLRSVANASDKDLVPLGFQCLRILMEDGLILMPASAMDICIDVAGAYGTQRTDINISLTALGLLWSSSDFFGRGVNQESHEGSLVPARKDLDCDKLLLAVFGVIQSLGVDERPEVRNSAIRTLFQALTTHGNKLSSSLWEHCLWNLIFPLIDTVRHLAAGSSREESLGKELGIKDGKPVHMLVHHSRNTAQKQWDESLVLVLNGASRITKPFFHVFQTLGRFSDVWATLISFAEGSIIYGSKEVAIAAINTLQTLMISQSSKGTSAAGYFDRGLLAYKNAAYGVCRPTKALEKTKQELLQSLGEVYTHGYKMFDCDSYVQLLAFVDLMIRYSGGDPSSSQGSIPQVQRTSLEVLPVLKPQGTRLVPMWPIFFQQLLSYLPGGELYSCEHCRAAEEELAKQQGRVKQDYEEGFRMVLSTAFSERVVSLIVELYKSLPYQSKKSLAADIIAALGRCMALRRDSSESRIWRTAVKCFNQLLQEEFPIDISELAAKDATSSKAHIWKELVDIYEAFLVGTCGRALVGDQAAEVLEADEQLEGSLLEVLTENVLPSCQDATEENVSRLIDLIDRCAARTSALSLESSSLLPPHCSRFSLLCLRKLFIICSKEAVAGKIALPVLVNRCKEIIQQYNDDENASGALPLPSTRTEEVHCVLEELSRTVLPTVLLRDALPSSPLPLVSHRVHLFLLYDSLCSLIATREAKVREGVMKLLRLVGCELGIVATQVV